MLKINLHKQFHQTADGAFFYLYNFFCFFRLLEQTNALDLYLNKHRFGYLNGNSWKGFNKLCDKRNINCVSLMFESKNYQVYKN